MWRRSGCRTGLEWADRLKFFPVLVIIIVRFGYGFVGDVVAEQPGTIICTAEVGKGAFGDYGLLLRPK
jgi:hypothetical protein